MSLFDGNVKGCSFLGHRKIEETKELKDRLVALIEDLIINHGVSTFLFGSRSEFNDFCHQVVTELKKTYENIKRVVYTCRSEGWVLESEREKQEREYSLLFKKQVKLLGFEEEFEHKTKYTSGKASYVERNYAMIDNSDYCIFYYDENYLPEKRKYSKHSVGYYQPKSGTAIAYEYATKKKKVIFNVKN